MAYADPEKQRAYHRDYKRTRRAQVVQTPGQTPLPPSFRLKTAQDVLALLAEQVEAVRDAPEASTLEKARVVGFLASIALRAVEAADISSRVEAVERTLKLRRDESWQPIAS